ncbi:ATP-grasp domain-containing protein [Neobacillus pocheonensis]|uniref:ATP-grasp domain-containing protein n=1 Tax=Neobacillus pocheonensis TaxID=363869 RepID=A0ABT0W6J9_9BACI|nr:ATP-grasp domain-containing protein [Neobacillus pocheonensis]
MRTVVFIGLQKSGSGREAVRAAESLGYFTVVFTNIKGNLLQRNEFPDVHKMIFVDLNDEKVMQEKIKHLQNQGLIIEAVISFVDGYVHTAAELCKQFCITKMPIEIEAIGKMENKIETRKFLQNTEFGINHAIYDKGQTLDSFMEKYNFDYPVILKSPNSTGSKDVLKAENESELKKHVERLLRRYPDIPILFEEYIEGPQYLVEVLVYNHDIHIVAVVEQEITKGERFIITGYSLLAQVPQDLYESLSNVVSAIIEKLQFTNGSCHFELRLQDDQWKVIEINSRISGGGMNKMVEAAYGINLAEQIIKVWLGLEPSLKHNNENFVFTQYITVSKKGTLQKVTGKKRALQHKGVLDVYIKPRKGALLQPPFSMGHRYAYVLATGSTIEEAKGIAKASAKEIEFHLDK